MTTELTLSNPLWAICAGGVGLIAALLMWKRKPADASGVAGVIAKLPTLLTGSRVSMLMSLVAIAGQAGSLKAAARKVLEAVLAMLKKEGVAVPDPVPPANPQPPAAT